MVWNKAPFLRGFCATPARIKEGVLPDGTGRRMTVWS